MSNDVAAAAERLRFDGPLNKSPYYTEGGNWHSFDHCQLRRDQEALADAWLAEHPVDDSEPVTEAWSKSIGAKFLPELDGGLGFYLGDDPCDEDIEWPAIQIGTGWVVIVNLNNVDRCHLTLLENPTRGQLRRLLAALTERQP